MAVDTFCVGVGKVYLQHVVVQYRHCGLGLLGDVQETEGGGAVGIHDSVQIDLAATPLSVPAKKVSADSRSPGATLST